MFFTSYGRFGQLYKTTFWGICLRRIHRFAARMPIGRTEKWKQREALWLTQKLMALRSCVPRKVKPTDYHNFPMDVRKKTRIKKRGRRGGIRRRLRTRKSRPALPSMPLANLRFMSVCLYLYMPWSRGRKHIQSRPAQCQAALHSRPRTPSGGCRPGLTRTVLTEEKKNRRIIDCVNNHI